MNVSIILFEKFQDLDVFGPAAVLASIPSYEMAYFSQHGGLVKGSCGARIKFKGKSCPWSTAFHG